MKAPVAPSAGRSSYQLLPDLRGINRADEALFARVGRGAHARLAWLIAAAFVIGAGVGTVVGLLDVVWWIGPAVGALLFVTIVAGMPHLSLSPSDRQLLRLLDISTQDTSRLWQKAYPYLDEPTDRVAVESWLTTSSADELDHDSLGLEASGLMWLGRYEEAQARIARMKEDRPMRAFVREFLSAKTEFQAGGSGSLAEARRLVAFLSGDDRRVATAELALEEAGRAVVHGRDWGPVVAEAAGSVGGPSIRIRLLSIAVRLYRHGLAIALGALIVALVVGVSQRMA